MGTGSYECRLPFVGLGGKCWTWRWWPTDRWAGSADLLGEDSSDRNLEGLSARNFEVSLVPVELDSVTSLRLGSEPSMQHGLQWTVLRKAGTTWRCVRVLS